MATEKTATEKTTIDPMLKTMATVLEQTGTAALIDMLRQQLDTATEQVKTSEAARKDLAAQVERLQAAAKTLQDERPRVPVDNITTVFKNLLESTQPDRNPPPGDVAATLQSVEIDLKGFVEIADGKTHLVVPKIGEAVDANALSTVRLAFGTVPVVRPTEVQTPPTPAAEEPPPGKRRAAKKP